MKKTDKAIRIIPEQLTTFAPFIILTDKKLIIKWASKAVIKRDEKIIGKKISDVVTVKTPLKKITVSGLKKHQGKRFNFILLNKKAPVNLIGYWFETEKGFLLMATPDVKTTEELSIFSFEDFPENDRTIDFLVAQDEIKYSLNEAARVSNILKEHNQALENSKKKLESLNADLKKEIAERKRIEAELIEARKVALQASRTKSEFLASMSHEIRTPMNAIIGMADLLWETDLTPEQQQYVKIFRNAGENLLNIINDILDISKVEAGQIELENIDFNLNDLIEKTCEIMALRAHTKNLELTYHLKSDVPTELVGDPIRLRQIIVNLVGNAIKFTEEGEVVIRIEKLKEKKDEEKNSVTIFFSVSDTGIGIPEDKLNTIFDTFTQADASTTRKYGGTGLGLAISKKLVELMNGKIWVESKVGKGSTFRFTAKFGLAEKTKKEKTPPLIDLNGVSILVVDDNATNRLILRELLSGWGAEVTEAENGARAVALVKKASRTDNFYDLILMDCRMPGMGGFEVVERINEILGEIKTTIMMLTSDRRKGDIAKCRELNIATYLVKPIKKSELQNAIRVALGKAKVKAKKDKKKKKDHQKTTSAPNILLVEDSEDNRFLIQAYLKKIVCRIDIAENGAIAVEKFKKNKYDIILMDMQMPVMDGYTATREIRKLEKEKGLKHTPIIALTAYALKEEIKKSLDAGCDIHLSKPIKKVKLLGIIKKYTGENL